jgi:hypothetical protein
MTLSLRSFDGIFFSLIQTQSLDGRNDQINGAWTLSPYPASITFAQRIGVPLPHYHLQR